MKQKTIYRSKYLHIGYCELADLFIQSWLHEVLTLDAFKTEMLNYTEFYKEFQPKKALWIQYDFSLELCSTDYEWIEKNVNIPCFEHGNRKLAFVVGEQIAIDSTVIKSFDEPVSCIKPNYFPSEIEALTWLLYDDEDVSKIEKENPVEIKLAKVSHGKATFEISVPSEKLKETVLLLDSILQKEKFQKENQLLFSKLSNKEQEVLKDLTNGLPVEKIADKTNTSPYTIRTHVRNMKKKLNLSRESELIIFGLMFM